MFSYNTGKTHSAVLEPKNTQFILGTESSITLMAYKETN